MIDVHAPHQRVQTLRDFLLHLLVITIGLLIALTFEAAAALVHHRHQRDEAEDTLRQEMKDNDAQLAHAHTSIAAEQKSLLLAIQFLEALEAHKPADPKGINLGFALVPLSDAGWRTASATGVLTYFEYDHVQRYAAAYQMQDQFAAIEQASFDTFLQLNSYVVADADPTRMNPNEVREGMRDLHQAYAHLEALDQLGTTLSATYEKALANK